MNADLVERTIAFCRALRARGLLVTPAHSSEAVRALREVGLESRAQAYYALRSVLTARPEDFDAFDDLFDALFSPPREDQGGDGKLRAPRLQRPAPDAKTPPSLSGWLDQKAAMGEGEEEPEEVPAASDQPALGKKDFSSFTSEELEEIERIAKRISRRMAARPSRRWIAARRGARVDLRRTVRRSLSTAAEPLELRFRERKTRKTRIVAICDVSGSMDLYSRFLLQFLYGLQGTAARVESFVFSTTIRRITSLLKEPTYEGALVGLRDEVHDWSGGTRIGACLSTFNGEWDKLVDRRTVVVILSDGWDTGDPDLLAAELQRLKMRSRKLVWLNPLLGSPDYQPLTQGMQAALPHLDVFAPVHNLASLHALERHLT
jgi:uncharacterized protein with von Willebrand factor type A (vWA) domain